MRSLAAPLLALVLFGCQAAELTAPGLAPPPPQTIQECQHGTLWLEHADDQVEVWARMRTVPGWVGNKAWTLDWTTPADQAVPVVHFGPAMETWAQTGWNHYDHPTWGPAIRILAAAGVTLPEPGPPRGH